LRTRWALAATVRNRGFLAREAGEMGIRFKCPNGHKINVKAFLAGKRARCPECDAKVVVPYESQTTPTLSAMAAPAPATNGSSGSANGGANGSSASKKPAAANVSAASTVASAAPVSAHAAQPSASPSMLPSVSPTFNANLAAAAAVVSAPTAPASPAMPPGGMVDAIAEAPQDKIFHDSIKKQINLESVTS
jgi:hypothetical protein